MTSLGPKFLPNVEQVGTFTPKIPFGVGRKKTDNWMKMRKRKNF